MSASRDRRNLVIGVGNPDRGDDAIGLVVARQVKQIAPPGVTVIEENGDGATLMELWKGAGTVVLVDAVHCRAVRGTIYRFDACSNPIPAQCFGFSTHALGLAQGIELSRVLNQLPNRLIVYGVVGGNFHLGTSPGRTVEAAARQVARKVLKEVSDAK